MRKRLPRAMTPPPPPPTIPTAFSKVGKYGGAKIEPSAGRMNTVSKYVIRLDLLNNHTKFCGDTISCSRENDVRSCLYIFGNFTDISKLKLSLRTGLRGAGCDVECLYFLQIELPFSLRVSVETGSSTGLFLFIYLQVF